MLRKIALEEHVLSPGLIEYWAPRVATLDRTAADILFRRLADLGDSRIGQMNRAGIERAVLSITGPGVQAEPVVATAVRKASEANDFIAREIRKRPQSYSGFAHLPIQDPAAAAAELERCCRDLEFCGALIYGSGHDGSPDSGHDLDAPAYDRFWEVVEALGVPVYLRASGSGAADYQALSGWNNTVETASQVLRLVFGGVFDRYPNARVILGQLGEALPYRLPALDAEARRERAYLRHPPSHYFRENIFVTTAGLLSAPPLYCAVAALGPAQVMFGTGYPIEPMESAGTFLDTVRLDEGLRADIAFRNAERLLRL